MKAGQCSAAQIRMRFYRGSLCITEELLLRLPPIGCILTQRGIIEFMTGMVTEALYTIPQRQCQCNALDPKGVKRIQVLCASVRHTVRKDKLRGSVFLRSVTHSRCTHSCWEGSSQQRCEWYRTGAVLGNILLQDVALKTACGCQTQRAEWGPSAPLSTCLHIFPRVFRESERNASLLALVSSLSCRKET